MGVKATTNVENKPKATVKNLQFIEKLDKLIGIVEKAEEKYAELGEPQNLYHKRYQGGHALTEERFADILEWIGGIAIL